MSFMTSSRTSHHHTFMFSVFAKPGFSLSFQYESFDNHTSRPQESLAFLKRRKKKKQKKQQTEIRLRKSKEEQEREKKKDDKYVGQ